MENSQALQMCRLQILKRFPFDFKIAKRTITAVSTANLTDQMLMASILGDFTAQLPVEGEFDEFVPTDEQVAVHGAIVSFVLRETSIITVVSSVIELVCVSSEAGCDSLQAGEHNRESFYETLQQALKFLYRILAAVAVSKYVLENVTLL